MKQLRIFYAAGLAPVIEQMRESARQDLCVELLAEASGSQMACRKLTELGRPCDLLVLADNNLVVELLRGHCDWRIDFATDEVVLGVGVRAPETDAAETNWPAVLLKPGARIARVDENLAPIGYRTLLVWKLREARGAPGLCERLLGKCERVVDDVERLAPLLKTGETDYAFLYRSTCIASDIRHIELDRRINLGASDVDYGGATVTFEKLKAGAKEKVTVRGMPITWTLTIPSKGADANTAAIFVEYLLTKQRALLEQNGFRVLDQPIFYGPESAFQPFAELARRAGEMQKMSGN